MLKVNFIEASNLVGIGRHTPSLRSTACEESLKTYKENILRHSALLALPGYASLTAMAWTSSSIQAQQERFGFNSVVTQEMLQPVVDQHVKRIKELMDQKMQGTNEEKRQNLSVLTLQFQDFASRSGSIYSNVLETVLKSVLILAWGSLETLIEDLHVNVLKEHPAIFSRVIGRKFRFRKRDLFRSAYSTAFSGDGTIQGILANKSIDALAVIRNLLVHKAGVVDDFFKNEAVGISLLDPFASLPSGRDYSYRWRNRFADC